MLTSPVRKIVLASVQHVIKSEIGEMPLPPGPEPPRPLNSSVFRLSMTPSAVLAREASTATTSSSHQSHNRKRVETPEPTPCVTNPNLMHSGRNNLKQFFKSLEQSFKRCPKLIWKFYIEALLVPSFRHEWNKYKHWDPDVYVMTKKERDRKKRWKHSDARKKLQLIVKYHFNTDDYRGHPHDHENCTRIRINVSGRMYETQIRSLNRFPKTLLGDPDRRLPYYDPGQQCFYFDRHRESFEMILYYYQSGGRLRRPYDIDTLVFYGELVFFDLGEDVLTEFKESEGYYADDEEIKVLPKNLYQRKIWLLFEYPESSSLATVLAVNSVLTIILSIVAFCVETMPMFGEQVNREDSDGDGVVELNEKKAADFADIFNIIETICVLWFAIEFLVRLISCPKKVHFCTDIMNIIDFVAIVPYFVTMAASFSTQRSGDSKPMSQASYLSVLRVIRLVRVFRIFKLSRHSKGLQTLGLTLKASMRELGLLIFFLVIGVVLFSSAVYFAEQGPHSKYPSIPSAFYWGVVTMTTVGYGDMVPVTAIGKLIGTVTAVAGVLTIALPVPVIVSNFNFFYARATEKKGIDGDAVNPDHVKMCPFLPGNGIHPDAPPGYDGTLLDVNTEGSMAAVGSGDSKKSRRKSKDIN